MGLVAASEDFSVQVDAYGDTVVLAVAGEVDVATAPELWASVAGALATPPAQLVFDVAALRFIDSSGLSVIVRTYRAMQPHGGKVLLRSPSSAVRQVLDIAGIGRIVTIED